MATPLNPTWRFHCRLAEGLVDFSTREEIDGLLMLYGVTADRIAEQREKVVTRPDDVFIATYPKCGTTLTQQIVKLMAHDGVDTGVECDVFVPWHEHMTLEEMESKDSPRFFKSHLRYRLLPGGEPAKTKAKYIYVMRNPKDAVLSYYNHVQKLFPAQYVPTWEVFFENFFSEDVPYGTCFSHFLEWWAHKDAPNILILTFEQLMRGRRAAVTAIASFLGYNLTDEIIDKIVVETSFDKMKDNKSANKEYLNPVTTRSDIFFMNKGIIGNWRNKLTPEESARIDAAVAEKLKDTGIVFDYGDI